MDVKFHCLHQIELYYIIVLAEIENSSHLDCYWEMSLWIWLLWDSKTFDRNESKWHRLPTRYVARTWPFKRHC